MTKQIVAMVESHGFKLQRQKNHYVFKHPSGKVFVCGKTLSDKRALMNIRKEVVRILLKE
jgi:predicted RNA binding protein YcfA (HicA-like mRNA interferase family)